MTGKDTPFGYRYTGGSVFIKLRLLESKFLKYGIDKYGAYRHTNSGYVIFETMLDTKSDDFKELNSKLSTLRTEKAS